MATQEQVTATWDAEAASWDNPGTMAYCEQAHSLLLSLVAIEPSMTVLDFGCGSGLMTAKLRSACGRVVALDASPAMVARVAAKKAEQTWENVTPLNLVVSESTAGQLRAAAGDGGFDLAIASSVCMFVPDLHATLRALASTLKPGASFVHLDWAAEGSDYNSGFNEAIASELYAAAGLTRVHASTESFSFPGSEGAPPETMQVFVGVARR
jgi:ubiquinone/menaquinone biosynthesis C-methylase UbiE